MQTTGPTTKTVIRVCLVVAAVAASLLIAWQLRGVLKLIFIAAFLTVALGPPTDGLVARGLPRTTAVSIVYLVLLTMIGVLIWLVAPPVAAEVSHFAKQAPELMRQIQESQAVKSLGLSDAFGGSDLLQRQIGDAAGAAQTFTLTLGGAFLKIVAVLTMSFLALREIPRAKVAMQTLLPTQHHNRAGEVARQVYATVGGYIAGISMLGLVAGTTTWVTLTLLDVPYALPLAILVGLLDFVPLIGGTIAVFAVGLVCLASGIEQALIWVVVYSSYQGIENSLLQPAIYSRTVSVHPLLVIIALLSGAALLGVMGALMAIPVAAVLQILLRDWWQHRRTPVVLPGGLVIQVPGQQTTTTAAGGSPPPAP